MAGKADKIALFIDFENLETGVSRQSNGRVDIDLLLNSINNQGVFSIQRAYADWQKQSSYRQSMLQAGIQLVECASTWSGPIGTDIKLAIDAVENALHPNSAETFVIVTGNSNFLPLVYKLKELGKTVWVYAVDTSHDQIRATADQYIPYGGQPGSAPVAKKSNKPQRIPGEALKTIAKILTEHPDYKLSAPALKEEILKKSSSFDESNYGSRSFEDFVEFIQKKKLLPIRVEKKGEECLVQLIDEKAEKEKEEQWEDRPMTEKEWEAFMEAVEGCINEGAGRANQGKLWIINAYLHRKRVDGVLPLTNNVLFSSLQALTEYGALRRTDNDCYLLEDDYQYKKEDFLDELFGVEIDEEFFDDSSEAEETSEDE